MAGTAKIRETGNLGLEERFHRCWELSTEVVFVHLLRSVQVRKLPDSARR